MELKLKDRSSMLDTILISGLESFQLLYIHLIFVSSFIKLNVAS